MRRRDFVVLGGAALAWPLAARAQEAGRTYRVGGVSLNRNAPYIVAVFDELRRSGFIEGENLVIDWRSYGAQADLIPKFLTELAEARVDVILVFGDVAIRAAQRTTATIPILANTDDMVASGLVKSLAHPGGNTTGMSFLAAELDGKRQEILIEAVPGLSHIAALADSNTTASPRLDALQDAASTRSIELSIQRIARPDEIAAAIEAAKRSGATALNVLASPMLHGSRQIIMQRVAELRLPAIYQWPETAEEGGLIAYGPGLVQSFREVMTRQLVKLLRGAKPADLPIEQPTKFELVINLKTAKALGHTIPSTLLARADEVIE